MYCKVFIEKHNTYDGNKNNLRTIEAQIVQKLKNNELRTKSTGSYQEMSVYTESIQRTVSLLQSKY